VNTSLALDMELYSCSWGAPAAGACGVAASAGAGATAAVLQAAPLTVDPHLRRTRHTASADMQGMTDGAPSMGTSKHQACESPPQGRIYLDLRCRLVARG
jgi:hypothetical protein